jgi:hypothetical protein
MLLASFLALAAADPCAAVFDTTATCGAVEQAAAPAPPDGPGTALVVGGAPVPSSVFAGELAFAATVAAAVGGGLVSASYAAVDPATKDATFYAAVSLFGASGLMLGATVAFIVFDPATGAVRAEPS